MRANPGRGVPVVLLIAALVWGVAGPATAGMDFPGYSANYLSYQHLAPDAARLFGVDSYSTEALSRLRLKPAVTLSSTSRIGLEYEIDAIYQTSGPLFPLELGRTSRQIVDLTWNPVDDDHFSLIHTVDRLYFRYGPQSGEVVLGRQGITWGTGRIWNPTDLFNPINPVDYARTEKPGTDALSLKVYLGAFSGVNLVVQPQDRGEDWNSGYRLTLHAGEYDFSLMGGYFDRRVVAGGDFAGNLFEAGTRGEGIISMDPGPGDSAFVKFILGIDQQLTSRLYGLIEYHFNGEGKARRQDYDIARLMAGRIINLGRHFVFIEADYLVHPLWNLSLSLDQSLTDGSGFAGFLLTYSASGSADIALGAQRTFGGDLTEFWYYPSSLYLRGTLYF
jgi:hypothetical protein